MGTHGSFSAIHYTSGVLIFCIPNKQPWGSIPSPADDIHNSLSLENRPRMQLKILQSMQPWISSFFARFSGTKVYTRGKPCVKSNHQIARGYLSTLTSCLLYKSPVSHSINQQTIHEHILINLQIRQSVKWYQRRHIRRCYIYIDLYIGR